MAAPSRVNRRSAAYLPTEKELQHSVIEGLERLGCVVIPLGAFRTRVKCPCGCGHWFFPPGGYGNGVAAPDLLVGREDMGLNLRGIELKAPGGMSLFGKVQPGHIRPEQQALADKGLISIAHSFDEVVAALQRRK